MDAFYKEVADKGVEMIQFKTEYNGTVYSGEFGYSDQRNGDETTERFYVLIASPKSFRCIGENRHTYGYRGTDDIFADSLKFAVSEMEEFYAMARQNKILPSKID